MAEKHAVVRTDLMEGTDVRSDLVSFRYKDASSKLADIDNGNVVKLVALQEGEREVYDAVAVEADEASLNDVVLVAGVEIMYDERLKNLEDYYNVAGKAVRGYRLHHGRIFSVTKEALDGVAAPVKGDIVELKAGTKLNVAKSLTSGSTQVGVICDVETQGSRTWYAIEVK